MNYKNFKIVKLYKKNLNDKYIIKINDDILDYSKTIKEAKNIINEFIKNNKKEGNY